MTYPRPYEGITTLRGAIDHLNDAFATQLEQASLQQTAPNEAIAGDSQVREAFWALLSPDDQRRFFLRIVSDRHFWPRLRSLVGSPPYSFLRSEDEGVLRAAGICKGRAHMSHIEATTTGYNEFGKGHYEDAVGRLYRMITKEHPNANDLPWTGLTAGVRVVADVRVKKHSTATKSAIAKGARGSVAQEALVFPRVGDTLTLRLVPALRASGEKGDGEDTLRARVDLGRQKAPASPVARLVLRVK